ncbi:hypothetical protein [Halolamina sp. C58]|uniref:hypothetical protein n=1 Tax=Halolamina sp. C58 TaxID=3421640 RepID=UPI003EBAD37D
MRPDRNSLQSVTGAAAATVAFLVTRFAETGSSALELLRRVVARVRGLLKRGKRRAVELLAGPGKRFVTGPLRAALLGRETRRSLGALLSAPVLALAVAWWVGSTVGYATLVAWVRGTWFGTAPSLAVFAAVAALLLLATASAAVNSGLLPTTLLVSAPIFGAAVTRYGTTVTYAWGAEVVSLPNAVGTATAIGLGFGVPIAVAGFLLGSVLRRSATTLRIRGAAESA